MDRYDLVHENDQWKLKKEGGKRALSTFDTKAEGLKESSSYVRSHGGSLRIRREDNQIQEERTYPRSQDPRKSPG